MLRLVVYLSAVLMASTSQAGLVGWDWNDPANGKMGWQAESPFVLPFGGTTTTGSSSYNYDAALQAGDFQFDFPYCNRCDGTYLSKQKTNYRTIKYRSNPLDTKVHGKTLTFDIKGRGPIAEIRAGGQTFSRDQLILSSQSDGSIKVTLPFERNIEVGTQLRFNVSFEQSQKSNGKVNLDNVTIRTVNPRTQTVTYGGETFQVPIGFGNFNGVLDSEGNQIKASPEASAVMLATSQSLAEIENFDTNLSNSLGELIDISKKIVGAQFLRDNLTTLTGALIPGEPVNTFTGAYFSLIGNVSDMATDSHSLVLASSTAGVARESIATVEFYQRKIANGETLSATEIAAARESLRVAQGYSMATVEILKTVKNGADGFGGFFSNLVSAGADIAIGAGGAITAVPDVALDVNANKAQIEANVEAIKSIPKLQVKSPLSPEMLPAYQEIVVKRGYTSAAIATSYFDGFAPPNLQDAIHLSKQDGEDLLIRNKVSEHYPEI